MPTMWPATIDEAKHGGALPPEFDSLNYRPAREAVAKCGVTSIADLLALGPIAFFQAVEEYEVYDNVVAFLREEGYAHQTLMDKLHSRLPKAYLWPISVTVEYYLERTSDFYTDLATSADFHRAKAAVYESLKAVGMPSLQELARYTPGQLQTLMEQPSMTAAAYEILKKEVESFAGFMDVLRDHIRD